MTKRDDNGKPYSIEKACDHVGISISTWYRWVNDGLVITAKRAIADKLVDMAHQMFLPRYEAILETLMNMAVGLPPRYAPEMQVKAGDALKAIGMLQNMIMPVQKIGQSDNSQKSELEHVDSYQPQQIYVAGDLQFLYNGGGQPKFGKLDTPLIEDDDGIKFPTLGR